MSNLYNFEGKMLARVIKTFAILMIGWALGYAHCWFALMK